MPIPDGAAEPLMPLQRYPSPGAIRFLGRYVRRRFLSHAIVLMAVLAAVTCAVGSQYAVKNLVDVVTAEKQLAQARLSGVSSRSDLLLKAVDLEFLTGNLLRGRPALTKTQAEKD